MSRIATISPVWGCSVSELRELAKIAEGGGFEAILSPEVPPFNALSNAQVFAEATSNIKVGTWITNIYMRQAVMAAATSLTIQEVLVELFQSLFSPVLCLLVIIWVINNQGH